MSKKLINSLDNVVDECLRGLVDVHPGLTLLSGHRVVLRSDIDDVRKSRKVKKWEGSNNNNFFVVNECMSLMKYA